VSTDSSDTNALHAGAAAADITPAMGIQLAGDIGRHRPVEEIRERLHARALVLEADGRRCCILSLDLPSLTPAWVAEIRRRAHERLGLGPDALLVHATQNHSAPCIGHFFIRDECTLFPPDLPWLRGGDDRYNEPAVEAMLTAIGQAIDALVPVSVAAGRRADGRVAFNRRFVLRDGTVKTHPPACTADILHCEGPIDPEVGVVTFTGADGHAVAALPHHTCHPTHGYPTRYVIADWPGAWADGARELLGDPCVPLVLNGCCGNVSPSDHLHPSHTRDHREMGRKLTESTEAALGQMHTLAAAPLDWASRIVHIPVRQIGPDEVEAARKLLADHPEPIWRDEAKTAVEWDWVYAASALDLYDQTQGNPTFPFEIQAIRIGDAAIVGLMGEPFVEAQLRIKLESPAPHTLVGHMCNGGAGYVPTKRAFAAGGYETHTAAWSRLAPDALETIETESIALLKKLFGSA